MKRFLCFVIIYGIIQGIASAINPILGSLVAGIGFGTAYCFGEKT